MTAQRNPHAEDEEEDDHLGHFALERLRLEAARPPLAPIRSRRALSKARAGPCHLRMRRRPGAAGERLPAAPDWTLDLGGHACRPAGSGAPSRGIQVESGRRRRQTNSSGTVFISSGRSGTLSSGQRRQIGIRTRIGRRS